MSVKKIHELREPTCLITHCSMSEIYIETQYVLHKVLTING